MKKKKKTEGMGGKIVKMDRNIYSSHNDINAS